MSFRFPDVPNSAVNLGFLFPKLTDAPLKDFLLAPGLVFVPPFILSENSANTGFQRLPLFKATPKEVYAQRP